MNIIKNAVELKLEDMICIKTKWFNIGQGLKFPNMQPLGGFQPINNQENLDYISKFI